MAAGVAAGSTRERLTAARAAGTLDGEDGRALQEAFELLHRLRLDHQVDQLRTGSAPDNYIDPRRLDPLTRLLLRDALKTIAAVQQTIAAELDLRIR